MCYRSIKYSYPVCNNFVDQEDFDLNQALLTALSFYREFPALGANSGQAQLGNNSSQAQYQNASPAIWANQRAIQQTPVQRPQQQQQQQHVVNPQPSQQHPQTQSAQDQSQRGNDDLFASSSHLQSVMDDSRYQSALGQMPISRQPPTTNADEYPPLGRNSADENDDRRGNMLQSAGFGGFSNANAFSLPQEQSQPRNQPPSASSSQADNSRPSAGVDRLTSPNGIRFGGTFASCSGSFQYNSNTLISYLWRPFAFRANPSRTPGGSRPR